MPCVCPSPFHADGTAGFRARCAAVGDAYSGRRAGATMSFALWRGVVGMVRPTRRPGTLEELIRILPEGIGIVPLLLNFKAGSKDEFLNSIPLYERFASELAEQGVDMIMLSGAPPFMLLGRDKEASLTKAWTKKFKTPVLTDNAGRGAARDEDQDVYRSELFCPAEQDRAGLHDDRRIQGLVDGADRRALRSGRADLGRDALRPRQAPLSCASKRRRRVYPGRRLADGARRRAARKGFGHPRGARHHLPSLADPQAPPCAGNQAGLRAATF